MAYERDSDRKTRGAGAIAAFDQGSRNARMRQRRRVAQARATQTHDARMAAVERGALASLGRVNLRADAFRGGERFVTGGTMSRPFIPPVSRPPSVVTQMPVARVPPTPAYTGGNDLAIAPSDILPPPPVPGPVTVVMPKPPLPKGSGGSAPGVMPTGGPGPITTFDPSMVLPEVPSPTGGPSMRSVLLVGGAALAAYWLLGRRSP